MKYQEVERNRPVFTPARVLGATLAVGVIAGAAMLAPTPTPAAAQTAAVQTVAAQTKVLDVSDLAEKLLPSVVNISSTRVVNSPGLVDPQAPQGSPFQFFFGPNRPQRARSIGSGFIIDADGFIVTNNHVIADADTIMITLQDGTELKADIVGTDPLVDLALLKVDAGKPLPAVQWGDSDAVKVGQPVIAIGTPFGLGGTVTTGIISAVQRDIRQGPFDSFLQTDAAINSGNSGGPLFDMNGRVIGINTAIFSPSRGNVGIGFSIPQSIAAPVIDQLREFGRTRRGQLGVLIQPVTKPIARSLGLNEAAGAIVAEVLQGTPAEAAGLRSGDVIIAFNGEKVADSEDLTRKVAGTEPGKTVEFTLLRGGERLTKAVTLGERDDSATLQASRRGPRSGATPGAGNIVESLGLALAPLTTELRGRLGLDDSIEGVAVVAVRPDSTAAAMGVRSGDVIEEVDGAAANTPGDVATAVRKAQATGRNAVLLRVNRNGNRLFIGVDIDTTAGRAG